MTSTMIQTAAAAAAVATTIAAATTTATAINCDTGVQETRAYLLPSSMTSVSFVHDMAAVVQSGSVQILPSAAEESGF